MIFCNSGPIAAACYLEKSVVQEALDAFINGVINLIILSPLYILDKDLVIDFGFCKISMEHKSI
jgi:hypothetical protein